MTEPNMEEHCDKCLSKKGWMEGECFDGKCDCHAKPNMEWDEELRNWQDCAIDAGYDFPESSFSALKSIFSQAETRAYEKGKAEERERIAEAVKDERLNEMDSWDVSSKKILSLIHDNK